MPVRPAAALALLVCLASPGTAPAATDPCAADAALCVPATNPAGCRSMGGVTTFTSPAYHAPTEVIATPADSNPAARNEHVAAAGPVPGAPGPRVHVGGIESFCQAYLTPPTFANRKACGRAGAAEVMVDFGGGVIVTARDLFAEGCASSGVPSGPLNTATVGALTIAAGGTSRTFNGQIPPNTRIDLPDVQIGLNESFVVPGSCLRNHGSALRVSTPGQTLIVGWVSTSTCA